MIFIHSFGTNLRTDSALRKIDAIDLPTVTRGRIGMQTRCRIARYPGDRGLGAVALIAAPRVCRFYARIRECVELT